MGLSCCVRWSVRHLMRIDQLKAASALLDRSMRNAKDSSILGVVNPDVWGIESDGHADLLNEFWVRRVFKKWEWVSHLSLSLLQGSHPVCDAVTYLLLRTSLQLVVLDLNSDLIFQNQEFVKIRFAICEVRISLNSSDLNCQLLITFCNLVQLCTYHILALISLF